jgi:hypothetical protein
MALPNTFDNPDEYDSNWDWTVKHSNYHFDNTKRDQQGEWYQVLGRFQGDWSEDLAKLKEDQTKPITWATRKFYGDSADESPMLRQEEYDLENTGAGKDLVLTNMTDELDDYPMLKKMANYFGITNAKKRIHHQMPGQMFNLHIDKLWERSPNNPDKVIRLTILLEDWQPGQFYLYGTHTYSHWRAGEIHIFDWANVPHATANASRFPRPTIQVTGLKSQKTEDLLFKATAQTIYNI